MFEGLTHEAREAKSWPFEQARLLVARILRLRLSEDERDFASSLIEAGDARKAVEALPALRDAVVFECGFGPSGLPHLGTFTEVARPSMVRQAFRALTDDAIPTRLIVVSDDMDGMRRIAPNLPNQAMLHEDIGKPLSVVRDPFEKFDSFAAHNNAMLRDFLDRAGFDYEFLSAAHAYRSGMYDKTLLTALARFDDIQAIMLPTLGPERRATYSPFLPISPRTGRVLEVPTLECHPEGGTIVFADEDGTMTEVPVTGAAVKMQWRPDWALRWTALGVDFEMSGKDLIDSVKISSRICRVLGGEPPDGFNFELFLDENGQRISKSKGNGLTMEEWLRYGVQESLDYYMFPSPRSAKRLYFDVIPRATDEYLQHLDAYNRRENATNRLDNAVWFVHRGQPPERGSPVSFTMLLNLVSAANASDTTILWGFLSRHLPGASPATEPLLDRLCAYAVEYYEGFVKPAKRFRSPDERERAAFADLLARLKALPVDCEDGELIQNEVYAAGKAAAFEPLRDWFGALYGVLLGEQQGPRFGSFAAIFGLNRTIGLIERALAGEDLSAA